MIDRESLRQFLKREGLYIVAISFVLLVLLGQASRPGQASGARHPSDGGSADACSSSTAGVVLRTAAIGLGAMVGVACLAWCAVKLFRGEVLVASRPRMDAPWGAWDVAKVATLYVAVLVCVFRMSRAIEALILCPGRTDGNALIGLLADSAARLALVASVCHVVLGYGASPRAVGVTRRDWRGALRKGVIAYLAFVPVYMGMVRAQIWLADRLGVTPPLQEPVRIATLTDSLGVLVMLTIFAVVVAPVTEELYFRAFMQSAMRRRLREREAITAGALVFACVHQNWFALLPLFALGLLLGYLYERTQSLVAPVTVHVLHNAAMLAMIFWFRPVHGA